MRVKSYYKFCIIILICFSASACKKKKKSTVPQAPNQQIVNSPVDFNIPKGLDNWDIKSGQELTNPDGIGFQLPLYLECLASLAYGESKYDQYAIRLQINNNQSGSLILVKGSNYYNPQEEFRNYRLVNTDGVTGSSLHDSFYINTTRLSFAATPTGFSAPYKAYVNLQRLSNGGIEVRQQGLMNNQNYVLDQKIFHCR